MDNLQQPLGVKQIPKDRSTARRDQICGEPLQPGLALSRPPPIETQSILFPWDPQDKKKETEPRDDMRREVVKGLVQKVPIGNNE